MNCCFAADFDSLLESILTCFAILIHSNSSFAYRCRVVLDDQDFRKVGAERIRIKLKGRSEGFGSYALRDAVLSLRHGNTLKVDNRVKVNVTFNGLNEIEVGEGGILSDEIVLR